MSLKLLEDAKLYPGKVLDKLTERHFRVISRAPEEAKQSLVDYLQKTFNERGELPSVRELEALSKELKPAEEVYTLEDWTCKLCGAVYKLIHISKDKHKIEKVA